MCNIFLATYFPYANRGRMAAAWLLPNGGEGFPFDADAMIDALADDEF